MTVLVVLATLVSSQAAAVCSITVPANTIECHMDATETCCLTREIRVQEVCCASFCIHGHRCVFEELIAEECVGFEELSGNANVMGVVKHAVAPSLAGHPALRMAWVGLVAQLEGQPAPSQ